MGRCKSLDSSADGYGRGEGFAAALLATLCPSKLALAVIHSTVVGQDGRSSGLTAPNGPSQTRLVLSALRQTGHSADGLRFVSLHGTGTPLGDPIEVSALGKALSSHGRRATVVLGAIKSCYGHSEGCAGLTGLVMAAQSVKQLRAAPIMHLRHLNHYVQDTLSSGPDIGKLAAALPRQPQTCDPAARMAGSSSFGMSGVNAHAILAPPTRAAPVARVWAQGPTTLLQQQRLWPSPLAHPIINYGSVLHQQVLFCAELLHPSLEFLKHYGAAGPCFSLPSAALLELVCAAGRTLTETAAAPLVTAAVLMLLRRSKPSLIICRMAAADGIVQAHADGRMCITATLSRPGGSHGYTAVVRAAACQTAAQSLLPWQAASATAPTVASIVLPNHWQSQGYCCHPAAAQAALSLNSLQSAGTLSGCEVYSVCVHPHVPSKSISQAAGAAASRSTCFSTSCEAPMMFVKNMSYSHVAWSDKDHQYKSVLWRAGWCPTELLHSESEATCTGCLIISTQPWTLGSLCSTVDDSCKDRSRLSSRLAPLVSLNAVWGGSAGVMDLFASCSPYVKQVLEVCVGTEAHLQALVDNSLAQHCLFVQPPEAAVDIAAALASYGCVARQPGKLQLSLVTYNQQESGSMSPSVTADVALLQGKPIMFGVPLLHDNGHCCGSLASTVPMPLRFAFKFLCTFTSPTCFLLKSFHGLQA